MEILCQQKFADLHDGDRIFYSNITRCYETFKEIEKLDHEVILITGNGPEFVGHYEDPNAKYNEAYQYLNDIFHNHPKNIKYWFAQNNITKKDNVIPIPLGMRNGIRSSVRPDHVTGHDWVVEQHLMLAETYKSKKPDPQKLVYVNYCDRPEHRRTIAKLCNDYLNSPFQYANLKYELYLSNILNHECAMSPIGVGVDCYRTYEILYCDRIPVTMKVGRHGVVYSDSTPPSWTGTHNAPPQDEEYPLYTEIYSKLPIVMLDSLEELKDKTHLKKLVDEQKNKEWDRNLIDFNYWKNMIYEHKERLN